jgi:hypothetical protein
MAGQVCFAQVTDLDQKTSIFKEFPGECHAESGR